MEWHRLATPRDDAWSVCPEKCPMKDLLINQLSQIKYEIIGFSETGAKAESRTKRTQTVDELIISADQGQPHVVGVGFVVNSRSTNRTIEVQIHSDRVPTLKLDVGRKEPLLIVQLYASHKDYGMDEIETH
jgi:hypothetical protein